MKTPGMVTCVGPAKPGGVRGGSTSDEEQRDEEEEEWWWSGAEAPLVTELSSWMVTGPGNSYLSGG